MRLTKRKRLAAAILLFGLFGNTVNASRRNETSFRNFSSDDSTNKEARVILEKALGVLAGLERLKAIKSIVFKGKGDEFRSADLQGPDPNTPVRTFHEETIGVLPAQDKALYEQRTGRHDGSFRWRKWIYSKIRETIPNKPIRYPAVTHFHNDHAGGARAFMAEGSTILTTPGNREYFEKLASARYSVVPDAFSQKPGPLKLETFDGKRVISDGERVVELLNLGKSPHSDENLVVYLPKERILFQGDLFYFAGFDQFPAKDPSRDRVMKFLGSWLMRNGLRPERIYGFHDRGFATMTQVRQVLRLKR